MPGRYQIILNDSANLQSGLNEMYFECERFIMQIQGELNKITDSITLKDVSIDEMAEYIKAVNALLVSKNNALKLKMDCFKIISDLLKNGGDLDATAGKINSKGSGFDVLALQKSLQNAKKPVKDDTEKVVYKIK